MKLLSLFITVICFIGCSKKPVSVSLTLENAVVKANDSAEIICQEQSYRFPLTEDGKGKVVIPIEKDCFAILNFKKNSTNIYLKSGDVLELTWNPKDWKGENIKVVSNDGGINAYMRKNIGRAFARGTQGSFMLKESDFMMNVDTTLQSIYKEIDATEFSTEIKDMLKAYSKYSILDWIFLYPRFHNYGKRMTKEEYMSYEQFNHYMFDQFEERPEYLCLTSYRAYATRWFYELMQLECFSDPYILKKECACECILDKVKDSSLKEYLLASTITPYIQTYGLENAEKIVDCFRTNVHNPMYVQAFEKNYKVWAKLAPGAPAFNFCYSDINGEKVRLSDFKGKYVLIDLWATWCKPCCYEIPFVKEIEHRLKDKNIVFVSISSDKDVEAWKKMVKEEKMGGVQLNFDRNRDFMNYFYAKSIPRFIIIDPEMKIVNAHAPKPSSGELEKILNELLK